MWLFRVRCLDGVQVDLFRRYFEQYHYDVGYVEAKGFLYPVETLFLEDVLQVRLVGLFSPLLAGDHV